MDCCLSHTKLRFPNLHAGALRRPIAFGLSVGRRPLVVAASKSGTSQCDFGGLNAPLELRTPAGKFLSGVLLDDRDSFQVAARKELKRLAADRDAAAARLQLSLGSDEACLHRRISELKNHECQEAVEDVMYMLIFCKFSEMRVHLVPRLSKCVCNGRLEIWPSKDWELESIHSIEVLQMVKEHLTAIIGYRANSNVTDSWATTSVQRLRLCRMYAASILYGYFLKSASLRYHLERGLNPSSRPRFARGLQHVSEFVSCGPVGTSPRIETMGQVSYRRERKPENLRFYVMGFDSETIQMCAKPRTKEAVSLVERHSCALFGDEEIGLIETDDVIITSYASLKRFLLEAVAFGSFLWDAESSVSAVYTLEEN